MSDLYFDKTSSPGGFVASKSAHSKREVGPTVRELVQNGLDAATGDGSVEMSFKIAKVETSKIPCIDRYKEILKQAIETKDKLVEMGKEEQSIKERNVARALKETSEKEHIYVLYCRDNGKGLNSKGLFSVTTEGQSRESGETKNKKGSWGLGHLQAFSASDLRYVLYAGKTTDKTLSTGQAILAGHQKDDLISYDASGLLLENEPTFNIFEDKDYLTKTPDILKDEIDALGDKTGSVVAILGFNFFRDKEREDVIKSMEEACALNFLVAIKNRKLVVTFKDESGGKETEERVLDENRVDEIIKSISGEKRARFDGFLSGKHAERVLRILNSSTSEEGTEGVRETEIKGCKILFSSSETSNSQTYLFRDGMWVTKKIWSPTKFAGCQPFECVLLVNGDPANSLIRRAEDVLHLELDRKLIEDDEGERQYQELLNKIENKLVDWAGEIEETESYSPPIALFQTGYQNPKQEKAPIPPLRSGERSKKPIKDKERKNTPLLRDEEDPKDTGAIRRPAVENRVSYRETVNSGKITGLEFQSEISDEIPEQGLGISVYIPTGSDSSCENPLPPSPLELTGKKYGILITKEEIADSQIHKHIEFHEPQPLDTIFDIRVHKPKAATKEQPELTGDKK